MSDKLERIKELLNQYFSGEDFHNILEKVCSILVRNNTKKHFDSVYNQIEKELIVANDDEDICDNGKEAVLNIIAILFDQEKNIPKRNYYYKNTLSGNTFKVIFCSAEEKYSLISITNGNTYSGPKDTAMETFCDNLECFELIAKTTKELEDKIKKGEVTITN